MLEKVNLLGYSQKSLESFFHDLGEPSFRAKQLLKWIHQKGELDFDMMTDFNKILREKLKDLGYPSIDETNSLTSKAKSFVSCATGKFSK